MKLVIINMAKAIEGVFEEFQNSLMMYKSRFMGWSIILILLCHISGLDVPALQPMEAGMIGADFFILLSGYSLGHSISKHDVGAFYIRRFKRIFPMYFLLTTLGYAVVCVFRAPMSAVEWLTGLLCLPYYEIGGDRPRT